MWRTAGFAVALGLGIIPTLAAAAPAAAAEEATVVPSAVVCPAGGTYAERLAAREVRRYFYLRTGKLLPIVESLEAAGEGDAIVVTLGCSMRRKALGLLGNPQLPETLFPPIVGDWYSLKTVDHGGRKVLLLSGGYPAGTLYAAYRLAEHLGVRFYLHGDVVPEGQIRPELPALDERAKPLFDRRGIQPFHDFPEGPDWWDAEAYKAVLGQLPKLRMNFFGLHTYPQGGVGPEPAVWIGLPGDFDEKGNVTFSYPSRHFMTSNVTGSWGYRPMKTSDYTFGADALYDADDYGPDYMRGTHPWNQMSPEECNALFNRFGDVLADAFGLARQLGIKTCIGTETPLVIPSRVQEHLKALGKDPKDPAVVQELYEGMFRRIAKKHPLDYYWFWTPEGWTWGNVSQQQVDATLADLRAAVAAAKAAEARFKLATCGWVLGPPQDRALFDNVLPKEMPMSCINREVGHAPVEPGFERVEGRPKWAIPWLEDDPAMIIPQLWVGRMRKDAADACRYGCTGLLGIHWRTRILGPNVSALARAAWDQSGWNPALNPEAAAAAPKAPEGPEGGKHARFAGAEIAGTDDDPLYRSVRYDVGAYRFDLPNGKYTVTLKFCEPHYGEVHKRSFGVKLQGETVIDTLDIFRRAGKNKALDFTFKDVAVSDGRLAIEFVYQLEYPSIAAIAIEGPNFTRKVNCGGEAYRDYAADWPPADASGRQRYLASADFYLDWAKAEFGPAAAEPIAALFAGIDGHLPRPATWVGGPGGIKPDERPWSDVQKEYAFVDELAALRPKVEGDGNLDRFDYWLDTMRYLRAVGRVNCLWAQYNKAIEQVKAEQDADVRKRAARRLALPLRKEMVAAVGDVHRYLLSTVSTTGALGAVTNWQQHIMPGLLTGPGEELAKLLGEPLPDEALPPKRLPAGVPARVFVPAVRTAITAGEPLKLEAVVVQPLGATGPDVSLYWRPLGGGQFAKVPMEHAARGVWRAELPADQLAQDFEYYIEAEMIGGSVWLDAQHEAQELIKVRFPVTAPKLNQTVVVIGKD